MTSPSLLAQPSRSDGRSGRLLVRFVRLGRRLSQLPTGVLWAATLGWMAWIWWHSSKRGRVDVDPEFWWGWFTNLGHAPAFAFVALGLVAVESSRLRRRSGGARGVGEALVVPSVPVRWGILVATVFYGAIDEIHQSFVFGRTASWWDLCTDSCGALAVLWVVDYLPRPEATDRGLALRLLAGATACVTSAYFATVVD